MRVRRRAAGLLTTLAVLAAALVAATAPGAGAREEGTEPLGKDPPEADVTSPERVQPRIVGGSPAPTGAYPWHVVVDSFLGRCGGTLVATRWVMTAAHCVEGVSPLQLTLVIGRTVLSNTGQGEVRSASQIVIHPSYDRFTSRFDVALVRLSTPATRRWARPALAGDPFAPGDVLRAIGHGRTCESSCSGSDQLLQVDLPVQSDATMQSIYGSSFHAATMLGAGPLEGGKDTCQGDSGGPLFVPGALQPAVPGITSWGAGCARPDAPGVYAEVANSSIRSFLASTVTRPANDNFASSTTLSGASGQIGGSNTDATGEVGEPAHAGSEADTTVWYSWTAPSAAPVTFAVTSAGFDPTMAVYTGGSVSSLALVAADDDTVGLLPRVTFTPVAGTAYRIAVDGFNAAWGAFQLQWGPAAPAGGGTDFDFTGDGKANPAVYRPSTGQWFVNGGSPGLVTWGTTGDIPVPADYTGDGRADVAVYRPSTGQWFVNGGSPGLVTWGTTGDIPVLVPAAVHGRFFAP